MNRVGCVIAVGVLFLALQPTSAAEEKPLEPRVVLTDTPARIVKLTAHFRVTNSSDVDVTRYVFRVTTPPNLDSQRSFVLASDVMTAELKQHKSRANEYLEFQYPVPANREVINDVSFLVLLMPVDFMRVKRIDGRSISDRSTFEPFLKPSRHIESDSAEVLQAASKVFRRRSNDLSKARLAYQFPSSVLKFQLQSKPLGARQALIGGIGDCTEYSSLFSAMCRTQAIPARQVGVFNLGKNTEISVDQPNHHIAEVYLASHGWIPVDANLGRGQYNRPIGFGKLSNTIVMLNREGAWVWSTWLPPNGYSKSAGKPTVSYGISWDAEVLKEGSVRDLYREWNSQKPKG